MQQWSISRNVKDILLEVEERTKESSSYKMVINDQYTHFPFEILLLHNPKKKTIFQYRNRLTLTAAIELFNCVFNYIEEQPALTYKNKYNSINNIQTNNNIDDSFELIGNN